MSVVCLSLCCVVCDFFLITFSFSLRFDTRGLTLYLGSFISLLLLVLVFNMALVCFTFFVFKVYHLIMWIDLCSHNVVYTFLCTQMMLIVELNHIIIIKTYVCLFKISSPLYIEIHANYCFFISFYVGL